MPNTMPKKPSHLIVIRLSALGDVVLMTGVLKYWHETYGITCTVITQSLYASIFTNHPAVTEIAPLERRTSFLQLLRSLFALRKRYKGQSLIDLHGSLRSRLLSLIWQGTSKRFDKMAVTRRLFLRTHKACYAEKLAENNITQRYALTIEPHNAPAPSREKLCPCIFLSPEELTRARQSLAHLQVHTRSLVALHPFASHAGKTWPLSYWQTLIELLNAKNIPYILVGQGKPLPNIPEGNDFINKTDVRSLCALLAVSTVVISSDSGPMHMADAVGTPVIALFGPTTHDWGFVPVREHHVILEHDMPCRPCSLHGQSTCTHDHACLKDTTPECVVGAVEKFIVT